jgi:hypothetical protein
MNDNISVVKDYFKGFETSDRSIIKLADNLRHSSPHGVYTSAESFMNDCWQYAGASNQHDMEIVSEGNLVCTRYNTKTAKSNIMRISEWFKVENGKITDIEVFYDRKVE